MFSNRESLELSGLRFRTLGLSFVILIVIVMVAELAARSWFFRLHMPPASVGGHHRNLDIKIDRLEKFVHKHGRVDCVFIGSSTTFRGIVPEAFQRSYKEKTGCELLSFNFGLSGLGVPEYLVMAKIIMADYHPSILIMDMGVVALLKQEKNKNIAGNKWLKYRQGQFDKEGWLIEHLRAYRYVLRFLVWLKQEKNLLRLVKQDRLTTESGYCNSSSDRIMVKRKPLNMVKWLARFEYGRLTEMITETESFIDYLNGTELIFVDLPVHNYLFCLVNVSSSDEPQDYDYRRVKDQIMASVHRKGIAYFLPDGDIVIPDEGWRDVSHMNFRGANIFSSWLGNKVATRVLAKSNVVPYFDETIAGFR